MLALSFPLPRTEGGVTHRIPTLIVGMGAGYSVTSWLGVGLSSQPSIAPYLEGTLVGPDLFSASVSL